MTIRETSRRLTVQEAAEALGTSVDAVRMRVRRGSLDSEKEPDGRVYVYLNDDSSETRPRPDGEPAALISAKDETIAILRDQLREEREARRRADTLIAQLTQRIPELSAAPASGSETSERSGEPGASERVANGSPGAGGGRAGDAEAQNGSQRVGWWRRVFGG